MKKVLYRNWYRLEGMIGGMSLSLIVLLVLGTKVKLDKEKKRKEEKYEKSMMPNKKVSNENREKVIGFHANY